MNPDKIYPDKKNSEQNTSGKNIPDKIYRKTGTWTKQTGQNITDKIYISILYQSVRTCESRSRVRFGSIV